MKPTPIDTFTPFWLRDATERFFVDNVFWHSNWHCHRLPDRSFSLNNRQFHICARCTGLVIGMTLVPLAVIIPKTFTIAAITEMALFIIDGASQAFRLRTSNNSIRFFTGLLLPLASIYILLITILAKNNGI